MFTLLVGVAVGLVVGWNFFPQPTVMKNFVDKILGRG